MKFTIEYDSYDYQNPGELEAAADFLKLLAHIGNEKAEIRDQALRNLAEIDRDIIDADPLQNCENSMDIKKEVEEEQKVGLAVVEEVVTPKRRGRPPKSTATEATPVKVDPLKKESIDDFFDDVVEEDPVEEESGKEVTKDDILSLLKRIASLPQGDVNRAYANSWVVKRLESGYGVRGTANLKPEQYAKFYQELSDELERLGV